MQPPHEQEILEVEGTLDELSTVSREMCVRDNGTRWMFDVPLSCPILLHGERVKLRLLQPRDRLRVRYTRLPDRSIARSIQVIPATMRPERSMP
jgi:hypothetical protein